MASRTDPTWKLALSRATLVVLPVVAGSGCMLQAVYHGPLSESAVASQIETATGSDLLGGAGVRLGIDYGGTFARYFGGMRWMFVGGAEWDFVGDAHLFSLSAGAAYDVDMEWHRWHFRSGGGIAVLNLEVDGMDEAWTLGGFLAVGLASRYGASVDLRYRIADFDTDFGRLDASGVELAVGLRYPAYAIYLPFYGAPGVP